MESKEFDMEDDSLSLLRSKVKEEVAKSDFKRKLIGGISEEDVENYISAMRMKAEYTENELNERIEELISSRDKLKCEYNIQLENAEAEKKKLRKELEEVKQSLAQFQEECNAKDAQIAELAEQHKAEVERLSKVAISEDIEPLRQKLKLMEAALVEEKLLAATKDKALEDQLKANQRLSLEHGKLKAMLEEQLKSEHSSITRMLEENKKLNSKATLFNDELGSVKQQLEQERQRTEKAEQEMDDFLKHISELKEKINSSKDILENQFQQIGEKYSELQSDLQGLHEKAASTLNTNR